MMPPIFNPPPSGRRTRPVCKTSIPAQILAAPDLFQAVPDVVRGLGSFGVADEPFGSFHARPSLEKVRLRIRTHGSLHLPNAFTERKPLPSRAPFGLGKLLVRPRADDSLMKGEQIRGDSTTRSDCTLRAQRRICR